ncbi:serrate RNA effector molecule homolog isoform X3 [Nasonia vitripennis]|uniref:Serrate RNA effector molecule homolog n=1 Tax=Nasonia vitripennis TaxID=7425 RepID=A0A7M7T9H3_NASVI|nr:serrate RNA effector molecule homolog isoform X3 [Nasonia vitripennis]
MADSDDEYDRKRRDKFRGERTESYREGRGREDRRRGGDDWPEREWSSRPRTRPDYRDYRGGGGGGRERYSPARSQEMAPPMKRIRGEWDERPGRGHSGYGEYYGREGSEGGGGGGGGRGGSGWSQEHYGGSHHGNHHYGNHSNNSSSREVAGNFSNSNVETQPPMMTFKAFLGTQEDSITDEEAIKRYNEYKLEFRRQQLNEFFIAHKDEEWFKIKYHPEESVKRKEEQFAALKKRVEVFLEMLNNNEIDKVSVDADQTDSLLHLLDAVVIKLEGGTEEDLKVLDIKPPSQPVKESSTKEPVIKKEEDKESKESVKVENEKKSEDSEKPKEEAKEEAEEEKHNGDIEIKESKEEIDEAPEKKEDEENETSIEKEEKEEEKMEEEQEKKEEETKEAVDKLEEPTTKKRKRANSNSSTSSSSSSSSSDSADSNKPATPPGPPPTEDKDEEKEDKEENSEKSSEEKKSEKSKKEKSPEPEVEKPKKKKSVDSDAVIDLASEKEPRALHKTSSIFLRNLAPTITKAEVEAMCKRFPGFLRVAIADPQPERRWFRRGWVSFERAVNIKEICWSLNNIRLRDCELGAIVNRDLSRRVRTVNGITCHKQIVRNDIKLSAKIVHNLDNRSGLWVEDKKAALAEEEAKKEQSANDIEQAAFGLSSKNPILKNITDYLIEEASAEEEELLGVSGDHEEGQLSGEGEEKVEKDPALVKVLDKLILYLRIVHSVDYYNHCEYPNEDEMPNRCGIMHVRGSPPAGKVPSSELTEYCRNFESKMAAFLAPVATVSSSEFEKLGSKNAENEVEKFVQANTQELSKDKWLCPLSGKKFKGPDFIRKHIFNKHAEKVAEVKAEAEYFNNYLKDPKRPQLPEHPGNKAPPRDSAREGYTPFNSGGSRPPGRFAGNYGGNFGGNRGGFGGGYGAGFGGGFGAPRGNRGGFNRGRGGGEFRPVIHYRDLDAPREPDEFL